MSKSLIKLVKQNKQCSAWYKGWVLFCPVYVGICRSGEATVFARNNFLEYVFDFVEVILKFIVMCWEFIDPHYQLHEPYYPVSVSEVKINVENSHYDN